MRTGRAVSAAAATLAGLLAATSLNLAPAQAQAHGGVHHGGGHTCSPYVSIDRYSDALDKTTFQGSYVGNLSALAPQTHGRIAALSDRSKLFSLDARTHRPQRVIPLTDEEGTEIDSEGLVVDHDGSYFVTSEIEPSVRHYDNDGRLLDRLPVPDELRVAPAGRGQENQTFEGLTLSPDGRALTASMEGPLVEEPSDSRGRRVVRFQTWQRHGDTFELGRQYRYPLDKDLLVPEVHALRDGRFLLLERGFEPSIGNTIRLYLADPRKADVAAPMDKKLLADLGNCPSLGAHLPQPSSHPLLDNIEGMTVIGRTSDRRLRLLLVSDDNESSKQVTRLYEFTARVPA
ncbi:esterase-like activity of phytase family protein [Streptomyces sp. 3N207]|uniref:esterase-like activity of phytase family protein n=1 Tax=Streptomyces sp. 3N207 TaxID=3457417 RepID=UPI003FD55581